MSHLSEPKQAAAGAEAKARWSGRDATCLGFALIPAAALISKPELRQRLLPAALVTLAFALLAWKLRGVTGTGAVAGFLLTLTLFLGG